MSYPAVRKLISVQAICLGIVASLIGVGLLHLSQAYGDQLPSRSITLSRATPSANDTYQIRFTIPNNETLGSIELQICTEGPLPGTCTGPTGLDMSAAVLSSQAGATGFSIFNVSPNTITLGRPAQIVAAGTVVTYTIRNVTDPSAVGSYFGRLQTFTSTDGSGASTDFGGLAFAISNAVQISVTVPPYLYFCLGITISSTDCATATGDYLNFGDFSPFVASVAQTQMVAGSNADTGYNIVVSGTTLTSGNNTIPALAALDTSRPGVSQFGMNLVANIDPPVGQNPSGNGSGQPTNGYAQQNLYKFVPGDTVVTVPLPDEPRKYTTSYIANINKNQAAGIYVSTLTYIATGGF